MSASHQFYQQIFNLYNSTPGASKATPGSFTDPLGCNGWTNPNDPNDPNGLVVGQACAVHFFENLYHPASESIVSSRVDWNIGGNDRLFLLVQYDHGQRAVYLDPTSSAFNAYTNQPWWQGQLSETHTISATAANQFLLAATYISPTTRSVPVAPLGPTGPCGKGAVVPAAPIPCFPPQVLANGSPILALCYRRFSEIFHHPYIIGILGLAHESQVPAVRRGGQVRTLDVVPITLDVVPQEMCIAVQIHIQDG
jgi:hypothetical protein